MISPLQTIIRALIPLTFVGGEIITNLYKTLKDTKFHSNYVLAELHTTTKFLCGDACRENVRCNSYSYRESNGNCLLSNLTWSEFPTNAEISIGYVTFLGGSAGDFLDWTLVFRGTSGIGSDVYDAYLYGSNVSVNDVTCTDLSSTTCSYHYRNSLLDIWSSNTPERVKFSVYKDGSEVAFIEFDATGSDLTTWFNVSRVTDSSYTNITNYTYLFFSSYGYNQMRVFYTELRHNGCQWDQFFTAVIVNGLAPCTYDNHSAYPQIIYATGQTPGLPEQGGSDFAYADFFAIFVKL